jgi:hypothetical protein
MKTVSVEIKIPDGHEVVSIEVLANEYPPHCSDSGKLLLIKTKAAKPFLINGVPSDWPEWLICDWVAKDEDGKAWAYHFEPRIEGPRWVGKMHDASCLQNVNAIDIPGDWTQSKRENPNRKK